MRRRHEAGRLVRAVFVHAWRSGRWWTPAVVLLLALTAGVVVTVSHVVPVSIYVLF